MKRIIKKHSMIPVIDAEIDFNFDYLSIDRTFEIIIPSASSKLRE